MAEDNGSGTTALADFIWKNAEDLWGDFKHVDFGKIILPFTLLRRLECVLEPTRDDVAEAVETHGKSGIVINVLPIRETSKIKRSLHHALPTLPIREREEKWARP